MVPEPAAAGGDIGGVGAEQNEYSVPGSLQTLHQRALNDLKRARLSCGWYNSAPRPPPPPPRQQIVSHSQSSRVSPAQLTDRGEGVGLEPGSLYTVQLSLPAG